MYTMQLEINVIASQLFSSVAGIKFLLLSIITAGSSNIKTAPVSHVGWKIIQMRRQCCGWGPLSLK